MSVALIQKFSYTDRSCNTFLIHVLESLVGLGMDRVHESNKSMVCKEMEQFSEEEITDQIQDLFFKGGLFSVFSAVCTGLDLIQSLEHQTPVGAPTNRKVLVLLYEPEQIEGQEDVGFEVRVLLKPNNDPNLHKFIYTRYTIAQAEITPIYLCNCIPITQSCGFELSDVDENAFKEYLKSLFLLRGGEFDEEELKEPMESYDCTDSILQGIGRVRDNHIENYEINLEYVFGKLVTSMVKQSPETKELYFSN